MEEFVDLWFTFFQLSLVFSGETSPFQNSLLPFAPDRNFRRTPVTHLNLYA